MPTTTFKRPVWTLLLAGAGATLLLLNLAAIAYAWFGGHPASLAPDAAEARDAPYTLYAVLALVGLCLIALAWRRHRRLGSYAGDNLAARRRDHGVSERASPDPKEAGPISEGRVIGFKPSDPR